MTTSATGKYPLLPEVQGENYRQVLSVFFGDRLRMLDILHEKTGDIGLFHFLDRRLVLVNEAEMAGEVLLTREADFHKGPALSIYTRPLLGNGLLTSEGSFHRRQRRLAAPAFAHKRIVGYSETMVDAAERTQKAWLNGAMVEINHAMMRLTLSIVGKTLFNHDNIENEASELGKALTITMRYFTDVLRKPIRLPFAWVPPWRGDVRSAVARLDKTIYDLIRTRRETGEDVGDLLSMLMLARDEEGAQMDDKQIRDEAMTAFLAGHETTALALSWTWYLLAKHPAIYERVRKEVDTALGGRSPEYDDMEKMPYTLQVLKESMRLYPPAWAIVREAIVDTVIGGYRVPKGSVALISPYLLHRRPDYFPEPERFDPNRFTPDVEQKRPRYAYLPFGGGPRMCIGSAFALMEGHLVLATLVQRVTFSLVHPDQPVQPEALITLRPKEGILMKIERRETKEKKAYDL